MPISPTQRATAIQLLINSFGNDAVLGSYVPGLTSKNLITNLATALGTTFDAQLTTALGNLVTQMQASVTATQAGIADIQAQITAATVT